jgi:1-deoxyxylulose-5-phosphate synthase
MRTLNRREFLQAALPGAGLLTTLPAWVGCESAPSQSARFQGSQRVVLGKTGIRASRLAQGTGYNGSARSSDHTRMGAEAFGRLLHHSLDQGITFLDMADLYGSHPFVREAIKGSRRDNLVLLSKIWVRKEDWVTPSGGAREEVDRFRRELGTDRLDICLIHCMTDGKWLETYARVRDELSELKQRKIIRAAGLSCHNLDALRLAASHPWVDVIFARINHRGGSEFSMDGSLSDVSEVLRLARGNGKAVVGMKIFGAGKLVKPEEKDASLQYVLTQGLVDAITIGMKTPAEVDDTLQRMSAVRAA